jgi:hypothetical protein
VTEMHKILGATTKQKEKVKKTPQGGSTTAQFARRPIYPTQHYTLTKGINTTSSQSLVSQRSSKQMDYLFKVISSTRHLTQT